MKKLVGVALLLVAFSVGMIAGIRLFFPWEKVLELSFLKGAQIGNVSGLDIRAEAFSVDGALPSFVVKKAKIKAFMGEIRINEIRITPSLWKTLFTLAPSAEIDVEEGVLSLGGKDSSFSGSVACSLLKGAVSLEEWNFGGDLSVKGKVKFSMKNKKILLAAMSIKAPSEMDGPLSAASSMLPLKKGDDGIWILSREEGK